MVAKPKMIPLDTRIAFNDICMREMKLDITDDGILYDMDTESILQYKERFIKYREDENTLIYQNEIELDLLRDPRLMEILANIYLQKYSARTGINITSVYQSTSIIGERGYYGFTWVNNGINQEYRSDNYCNEALRVFNLICKLNNTCHLYTFEDFDIIEVRR